MNHEHDPQNPQRHEPDHNESKPRSDASGTGSSPALHDPNRPGIQQHRQDDPGPYQPTLPGFPLDELGAIARLENYSGPTPHSAEISRLNDIRPGMGNRIMDDAHDDIIDDRERTNRAFQHVLRESRFRLVTAIGLTVGSFAGIFISLFSLDPPESLLGATLFGLATIGPTINAFLNDRKKEPPAEDPGPDVSNSPGD